MIHTPLITSEKYTLFALQTDECPICRVRMLNKDKNNLFPYYVGMNQEAQMKKAGMEFKGSVFVKGSHICKKCEESGKATIKCELCGETKSSVKIQESFGEGSFLCSDCYETIPAKQWDEKYEELLEEHKWDNY